MEEFHVYKLIAVDGYGTAEGHHVDEGVAGSLLGPGRGAGKEVAADDLHQYTHHKGYVEDNSQKAQDMFKEAEETVQSLS